ncbi:hypothetical protein KKF82_07995 [Patescibacteria group bacterium]|nr:hypothetical protein [Patescibacteria group bacterium]
MKKPTKQTQQPNNKNVVVTPLPRSARDIEPVLAICAGDCGRITSCYSYPRKDGGFVYYCLRCKPRNDAAPQGF